jgi:hypothetical protein
VDFTGLPAGRYLLTTSGATREAITKPGSRLTVAVTWARGPKEALQIQKKS